MAMWNDYNDAKQNPNLMPKGTLAKVRLTIRPGGFDDASQGWTGGYATRGSTGAVHCQRIQRSHAGARRRQANSDNPTDGTGCFCCALSDDISSTPLNRQTEKNDDHPSNHP